MRLIDADAFVAKLDHVPMVQEAIRKAMDTMPTIAQPEIIKCKDCIHHHYENDKIPYCDRIDYGYGWRDDDYCSKGEKK